MAPAVRCALCGEVLPSQCGNCGFPKWRSDGHADFCKTPLWYLPDFEVAHHMRARHGLAA